MGSTISRESTGTLVSSATWTRTAPVRSTETCSMSESCASSGVSSRAVHVVPFAVIEGTSTFQAAASTAGA